MAHRPTVSMDELLQALEWVSAGLEFDNVAYVCRTSGRIYWISSEYDDLEDVPADIDDETKYAAVPNKRDLDLGKTLALDFVTQNLPEDYATVAGYFKRRGAYRQFKDLIEKRGKLEQWYAYESQAIERALREWADATGLEIGDVDSD